MSLIERVHGRHVYSRRVKVLCDWMAELIPPNASMLDVGCGDGLIANLIIDRRPDVQIRGIDVLVRPHTHIPVASYDGTTIPYPDNSFDLVMFVDVLHHTPDPMILLREAIRVAKEGIVIKDHTRDGLLAGATLRFMDWIGNARHGVVLPYNYWRRQRWFDAFGSLGLTPQGWNDKLNLYPAPASWLFDRSLHFVARLDTARGG